MSVEENKSLIRRLEVALNSGRVDAGLDLFADEFVYNGRRIARQDLIAIRGPLWAAVPAVRWTIEEVVAEGDTVATYWTVQGTHQREFRHPTLGHAPASGQPIQTSYMAMHRIAGGRFVEVRDVSDRVTLLQQLGVIPVLGPAQG